jgi:hypothetical protein
MANRDSREQRGASGGDQWEVVYWDGESYVVDLSTGALLDPRAEAKATAPLPDSAEGAAPSHELMDDSDAWDECQDTGDWPISQLSPTIVPIVRAAPGGRVIGGRRPRDDD